MYDDRPLDVDQEFTSELPGPTNFHPPSPLPALPKSYEDALKEIRAQSQRRYDEWQRQHPEPATEMSDEDLQNYCWDTHNIPPERLKEINTEQKRRIKERERRWHLANVQRIVATIVGKAKASLSLASMSPKGPDQVKPLCRLREWAEGKSPSIETIILSGPTGTGKTCLAAATFVTLTTEIGGIGTSIITTESGLLEEWREAARNKEQFDVESYQTAKYLIIDDAGSEKLTGGAMGQIFKIIDYRHAQGLSTLLTTNLARPQLAQSWGEKTVSRLTHAGRSEWIEVGGPDHRQTA